MNKQTSPRTNENQTEKEINGSTNNQTIQKTQELKLSFKQEKEAQKTQSRK